LSAISVCGSFVTRVVNDRKPQDRDKFPFLGAAVWVAI